jgi:hypothetical protein
MAIPDKQQKLFGQIVAGATDSRRGGRGRRSDNGYQMTQDTTLINDE